MFCYFLSFRPGGLVSWRTYECIKAVWRRENIFTTHAQARKSEFRGSCVFMLIRWRWEQTGVASAGCERSQFSICGLHIKQQSSMTGQKDWVPLFGFNQVCRYQPHPLWHQNNMFAPIFYQNKMWNCFLVIPIIIFKKTIILLFVLSLCFERMWMRFMREISVPCLESTVPAETLSHPRQLLTCPW